MGPFRQRFLLTLVACSLFACAWRLKARFGEDRLLITFFDVGQGDSALVRFPYGKTLLIDAGGGFGEWDAGRRTLFPELARMGILALDIALLTHPDQDHGYGFRGVFENLRVKELWVNESFLSERLKKPLLRDLLALSRTYGATVVSVEHARDLDFGGARVQVIPLGESGAKTNNRSLVLLLEFAGCRALFTADIEAIAETELLRHAFPEIELLKVAHHGSKTSSIPTFLQRAHARWAVVSVGIRNRYGHPSPLVLERLRRSDTQVFRTDFHGFVEFAISPSGEVHCRTALGTCGVAKCVPKPR